MAKNNLSNYKNADGLGFPLNFRRGNPNPLDNSSVWATLAEAQEYAQTSAVSYVGQILSVLSDDGTSVTIYSIQNEAGLLKEVGTVPVGDGNSITVKDGKIQILGVDEAETGAQLVKQADGTVKWIKPDTTTVDGLQTAVATLQGDVTELQGDVESLNTNKANKATTLSGYGIKDAYTKDEVDGKLSSVYKYKGSVATYSALPTENLEVGFVYNIEAADKKNGIKAGDNVAWNGAAWDVLAGTVDLSDYSTTEEVNTKINDQIEAYDGRIHSELANKVDVIEGKGLSTNDFTDNDKAKLDSVEANAQVNKIDSIDTDQFEISANIDKKLSIKSLDKSKITGLSDALSEKVDKVTGKGLSTNDFTNDLKTKLDKVNENAEINDIKKITLAGTEAVPDTETKTVDIPIATKIALGLVKSSDAENAVAVAGDGTMTVNSVNVNKLVQTAGDTLIIDGGALE